MPKAITSSALTKYGKRGQPYDDEDEKRPGAPRTHLRQSLELAKRPNSGLEFCCDNYCGFYVDKEKLTATLVSEKSFKAFQRNLQYYHSAGNYCCFNKETAESCYKFIRPYDPSNEKIFLNMSKKDQGSKSVSKAPRSSDNSETFVPASSIKRFSAGCTLRTRRASKKDRQYQHKNLVKQLLRKPSLEVPDSDSQMHSTSNSPTDRPEHGNIGPDGLRRPNVMEIPYLIGQTELPPVSFANVQRPVERSLVGPVPAKIAPSRLSIPIRKQDKDNPSRPRLLQETLPPFDLGINGYGYFPCLIDPSITVAKGTKTTDVFADETIPVRGSDGDE
ncbi:hypothetical protein E3P78_03946 [Wallemia ichthyophaga]|nr:hypothetical protein E3P78_03946 [Wallemia ichthyophaga]